MHRFEVRHNVLNLLKESEAYESHEDASAQKPMRVALSSRSGEVIEPMVLPQWYLNTDPLVNKMKSAFADKELEITPKYYQNLFQSWCDDIKHWCISRQLIWGHRMPVYRVSNQKSDHFWVAATSSKEALEIAESSYLDIDQASVEQV